jgi:hypothetical protein
MEGERERENASIKLWGLYGFVEKLSPQLSVA